MLRTLCIHTLLDQRYFILPVLGIEERDGVRGLAQRAQAFLLQTKHALRILAIKRTLNLVRQPALRLWPLHIGQRTLRQLLDRELANIHAVHPGQLLRVIDGPRYADALQRKLLDQLLASKELGLIVVGP